MKISLWNSWNNEIRVWNIRSAQIALFVTTQASQRSVILWLRYCSIICLLFLGINWYSYVQILHSCLGYFLCLYLIYMSNLWVMCLFLRPSLMRKDWRYVGQYGKHFAWYVGIVIALFVMFIAFNAVCPFNARWLYVSIPFSALWIFFFLESEAGAIDILKSVWQAFTMIVYNLPFCILILISWLIVDSLLHNICALFELNLIEYWLRIVMSFIWVSVSATLYIYKVHEQSPLYIVVP